MNSAVPFRPQEPLVEGEFPMTAEDFAAIAALVRDEAGIHLGQGKSTLVYSRLARRLRALGLPRFEDYVALVRAPGNADERSRMVAALTTNFTRFFREGHHFDHMRTQALPPLLAGLRRGGRLRIWSAGCSTGQEPYTIAMNLLEAMPDAPRHDARILATDINRDMLAQASRGIYDETALAEAPASARERWFDRTPEEFRVRDEVRRLVSFRLLNLMQPDWPMRGRFDIIFCRNVAIYFDEETQSRLWTRLACALAPGGHLYIGHSERLTGPAAAAFTVVGVTTYRHDGEKRA